MVSLPAVLHVKLKTKKSKNMEFKDKYLLKMQHYFEQFKTPKYDDVKMYALKTVWSFFFMVFVRST